MAVRPGPKNLITDVDGLRVGNADDAQVRSGVTVVLPDRPSVVAVDVRGGGPGTRETDALNPTCLVDRVDALVLTGGSAFGLDAASGAMGWLAGQGRGYPVGDAVVPIVPAAVLFDLLNGGDKGWGEIPPYRRLGLEACAAAAPEFPLGNAGAGFGAIAGDVKGGLGSASAVFDDGLQVGALVAANPVGSPVMPGQCTLWAWAWEQNGEMGGQRPPERPVSLDPDLRKLAAALPGANTMIGVVATNAVLSKAEALRVVTMAHDGMARAVRPAHTPFDGDTLFALATGTRPLPEGPARSLALAQIGAIAADCVTRAIGRAVYEAETLGDCVSYRVRYGGGD